MYSENGKLDIPKLQVRFYLGCSEVNGTPNKSDYKSNLDIDNSTSSCNADKATKDPIVGSSDLKSSIEYPTEDRCHDTWKIITIKSSFRLSVCMCALF